MEKLVNVRAIMDEITGVRAGLEDSNKDAKDINDYIITLQEFLQKNREERKENSVSYLLQNCNVPYYREIYNSSYIKFIKRIIRKLIKFCLFPIVEDQNAVNANILQLLNVQNEEIELLKKEIELLKKR